VGYEEGGQLTEAVRRRPYAVVLFDEVEKAHPDVFNVLLQILDDGRVTDSQGRTVDFKNTILILTSNLGSDIILDGINEQGEISEDARKAVDQLLKRSFRPEFLNRLDEIVFYKPLTRENVEQILELQLKDLARRLEDRRVLLEVTPAARSAIVDRGYDPMYGARPLKRYIQTAIETRIARKLIATDLEPDTTLVVDFQNGEFTVEEK
jgi:ATP-dependent Clp protease ATP-binding subunit ClpB